MSERGFWGELGSEKAAARWGYHDLVLSPSGFDGSLMLSYQ